VVGGADGVGAGLLVSVSTSGVDVAVASLEGMEDYRLGDSSRADKEM
jgi:hypothetical protein